MISPQKTRHWLTKKKLQLLSWAFFVFSVLFSSLFILDNFSSQTSDDPRPGRDFVAFWAASELAKTGVAEKAYDFEAINSIAASIDPKVGHFGWFYPPTYQAAIFPLSYLNHKTSYFTFIFSTLLLFFISAKILSKNQAGTFIILAFPAIMVNIAFGQNSFLTAAIAALGMAALGKRPVIAGILFGVLSIKPHLAILFPVAMVLGRYWVTLIAFFSTALAIVIASFFLLGQQVWIEFFKNIGTPTLWLETGKIPWRIMTSPFANTRLLGGNIETAYIIQGSFSFGLLAAMIYIWVKTTDSALRGSILILATLGFSPYMYDYELTWLAIPLILLSVRGLEKGWQPREREILVLLWLTPLISFILRLTIPGSMSIAPIAELILLLLLLVKCRAQSSSDAKVAHEGTTHRHHKAHKI